MAISSFDSHTTTFKFEETWNIELFSTLIKNNVCIQKNIICPNSEICTLHLSLYPNGENETYKNNVSLYIAANFKSNAKCVAFIEVKFSIIDKSGNKCKTLGFNHTFAFKSYGRGYPTFADHNQLLNSNSSWLHNDRLVIHFEGIASIQQFNYDDLSIDLRILLENQTHSDITFIIDETPIKAHKAILSARSPVFAAMFEHENTIEAKEGKITIEDITKSGFDQFLNYLYTGRIPAKELVTDDLLILADKYQIEALKSTCEEILSTSLTIDTVVTLLFLADLHNASVLKANCIDFIVQNALQVTHTEEWEKITEQRPKLNVEIVRLITKSKSGVTANYWGNAKTIVPNSTETITFTIAHTWKIDNVHDLVANSNLDRRMPPITQAVIKSAQFTAPGHEQIQLQLQLPLDELSNNSYNNVTVSLLVKRDSYVREDVNIDGIFSVLDENNKKLSTQRSMLGGMLNNFFIKTQVFNAQFLLGNILQGNNTSGSSNGQLIIQFEGTVTYKSLNFQKHIEKLSEDMGKLWKSGKHGDIESPLKGTQSKVHKCILSARSPVLLAMLEKVIKWKFKYTKLSLSSDIGIDEDTVQEVVAFIYTGIISEKSKLTFNLLKASLKFELPALRHASEIHLASSLAIATVSSSLLFAERENAQLLKKKCIEFIIANAYTVTHSTEWEQMETKPKLLNEVMRAITAKMIAC